MKFDRRVKIRNLKLIYAVSDNNVMGKDNALPWSCPADLTHFKQTTDGHAVIMGRKTWESMSGKPLRNRVNIVVTTQLDYEAPGAIVVKNMEAAVTAAQVSIARGTILGMTDIFVIGGKSILEQAAGMASTLIRTEIDITVEVNDNTVFGPDLDSILGDHLTTRRLPRGDNSRVPSAVVKTFHIV